MCVQVFAFLCGFWAQGFNRWGDNLLRSGSRSGHSCLSPAAHRGKGQGEIEDRRSGYEVVNDMVLRVL